MPAQPDQHLTDNTKDTRSANSHRGIPVSVVVLAKNEEANLPRCLDSLDWSNDVVVIDDSSTDNTPHVAEQLGARVVEHRFQSFAKQRNWALDNADLQNAWVLMLDADEAVTPKLAEQIRLAIDNVDDETVAFRMCRKTMLMGKWLKYSDDFPVWIMRLVRRGAAEFEDSGHGEVPVPAVDGRIGTIDEPFIHFPFSKGLTNWVERHNRYSSREANLEVQQDKNFSVHGLYSYDRSVRRSSLRALSRRLPCRSVLRFCYQYFWKWGFLEGRAGLTFSFLMATYEGLIVAKKREIEYRKSGEEL